MNTALHRNGHSEDCTISVARTIEQVQAIRESWQEHAWHPTMDLDVFLAALRWHTSAPQPYILSLSRNAKPVGILIGRLEDSALEVRVGYWSLWKAKLRVITIPHAGWMGDFSSQNAEAACRYLLGALDRREVEAVFFDWLPVESDLFKVVRSYSKIWWRNAVARPNPHWKITLPARAEDLWGSSHHRRAWSRRIFKKIEVDYPGKVVFRFFLKPSEVDTLCRDAEQVASKSYQRGLGVGFVNNETCRQKIDLYSNLGILRACVLYVDAVPVAYWIGSVYKKRFFSAYLAHDPACEKYEPGSLVFLKMLGSLCAEQAVEVDLGQGEGFYKQRFADKNVSEACLYVLAPSARNIALNTGCSAGEALASGAKEILSTLNVLQSLKKKWRRRLIEKNEGGGIKQTRHSEDIKTCL